MSLFFSSKPAWSEPNAIRIFSPVCQSEMVTRHRDRPVGLFGVFRDVGVLRRSLFHYIVPQAPGFFLCQSGAQHDKVALALPFGGEHVRLQLRELLMIDLGVLLSRFEVSVGAGDHGPG